MTKFKKSILQTKLKLWLNKKKKNYKHKKSNGDKIQKLKMQQNLKTQNVTKFKNSNSDNSEIQILTKLKKNQNVTKL